MNHEPAESRSTRLDRAIIELQSIIRRTYPEASFEVEYGHDDPEAIHLVATVDIDNTDDVYDLVADRLLELQIDEDLPLFVIPIRTQARTRAIRDSASESHPSFVAGS